MRNLQKGSSLIAVCFLIIVLSAVGVYFINLKDTITIFEKEEVTKQTEIEIKNAIEDYAARYGRYPCPAPLNADFDTQFFGLEPEDADLATIGYQCTNAAIRLIDGNAGEYVVEGRLGGQVRVGAIPVRTLNLPDKYVADKYNTRFVYAVTTAYADENGATIKTGGAISLVDANNNSVLNQDATGVFALISPRGDSNGAYDKKGSLINICNDNGSLSANNCDFQLTSGDASFSLSQTQKSEREDNYFMQNVLYTATDCEATSDPYKDVTFLVDSSYSMRKSVKDELCPEGTGTKCSRIEVARWAMRQIIPQIILKDYNSSIGGTGSDKVNVIQFIENKVYVTDPNPTLTAILSNTDLNNMEFKASYDDPTLGPKSAQDFDNIMDAIDKKLNFCPDGGTPLGQHVEAITQFTNDETDPRPNKIVVLTDGYHDGGSHFDVDKVKARLEVSGSGLTNTQIDFIDMTGKNNALSNGVANGGSFYSVSDPTGLINAFAKATGTCGNFTPKPVEVDKKVFCGDKKEPKPKPPGWTPPPKKPKKPKPPGWTPPPKKAS